MLISTFFTIITLKIQMLSFGQLKNNLESLKKFLTKMQMYDRFHLNPSDITEQSFRSKNPQLFLQLLNFIMIEYSKQLYAEIIQIDPLIKATNDQKFVESIFSICRKVLNFNPNLTVDQFLSNKFLEAKVDILAKLSKTVYNWDATKQKVLGKIQKKQRKHQILQLAKQQVYCEEDEQDQMPKKITIEPTPMSIDAPVKTKQSHQQKTISSKFTLSFAQTMANAVPKNDFSESSKAVYKQQSKRFELVNKLQESDQSDNDQSNSRKDYVSRQQFNQALELLSTVNMTVNNMVDKFNNFQNSVVGWVNNINAKVSIMQENIKMIKENL